MLGMAVLSPSHTQDIGHQDCTRTAHGSPIINSISVLPMYMYLQYLFLHMALFTTKVLMC
jgi:hypothetical protein